MTPPQESPVRVLLVDDDPLVRTGLRIMLGGDDDITVVGEVDDGAQVMDAVSRWRPNVVLMDIRMPLVDGIAATTTLTGGKSGGPAVIILTTFDGDDSVVAAMRAGASGFLVKHSRPEQIVDAVRRAATGEPVLSATVTRTLMSLAAGDPAVNERVIRARESLNRLSLRERDVAYAVADGLSNMEIGERLFMSAGTVKAHVSSALSKLELSNRIQLALLAHDARSP